LGLCRAGHWMLDTCYWRRPTIKNHQSEIRNLGPCPSLLPSVFARLPWPASLSRVNGVLASRCLHHWKRVTGNWRAGLRAAAKLGKRRRVWVRGNWLLALCAMPCALCSLLHHFVPGSVPLPIRLVRRFSGGLTAVPARGVAERS